MQYSQMIKSDTCHRTTGVSVRIVTHLFLHFISVDQIDAHVFQY